MVLKVVFNGVISHLFLKCLRRNLGSFFSPISPWQHQRINIKTFKSLLVDHWKNSKVLRRDRRQIYTILAKEDCCIFGPAFSCCVHLKAGLNTFFLQFSDFFLLFNFFFIFLIISQLKRRKIIKCVKLCQQVFVLLLTEGSLVPQISLDLQALYLSGTYCYKTRYKNP